jgi:hypothetical protein
MRLGIQIMKLLIVEFYFPFFQCPVLSVEERMTEDFTT